MKYMTATEMLKKQKRMERLWKQAVRKVKRKAYSTLDKIMAEIIQVSLDYQMELPNVKWFKLRRK